MFDSYLTRRAALFAWSAIAIAIAVAVVGLSGCSGGGSDVVSVEGHIRLAQGESGILVGHTIEAVSELDPLVRAHATIRDGGAFAFESLLEGVVRNGILPGRYRARIVIADDDDDIRRQAANAIPARMLDISTSDLVFEVPAAKKLEWTVPQS